MNQKKPLTPDDQDRFLQSLMQSALPDTESFEIQLRNRLNRERIRPSLEEDTVPFKQGGFFFLFPSMARPVFAIPVVLLIAGFLYFQNPFASKPVAQIIAMVGEVSLNSGSSDSMHLFSGNKISSGETGAASLLLSDQSIVRLDKQTQASVLQSRNLRLERGRLFAQVKSTGKGDRFQIATPQANVVVLGTEFEVISENEKTTVNVRQGKVRVEWNGSSAELTKGESLTLSGEMNDSQNVPQKNSVSTDIPSWTRKLMAVENQNPIFQAMSQHFPSRSLD